MSYFYGTFSIGLVVQMITACCSVHADLIPNDYQQDIGIWTLFADNDPPKRGNDTA